MNSTGNKPIFISHASANAPVAEAIVGLIEASGMRCWLAPRDVPGGSDYGTEIFTAIHNSKVLIALMSGEANASSHCLREVELAVRGGLTILPIRLDGTEATGGLEYRLATAQWLAYAQPGFQEALLTRLCALVASDDVHVESQAVPPTVDLVAPQPRTQPELQSIVGRETEVRQISDALQEVVKHGSGRLILVRGGSGVGKSILVGTIARQAAQTGFFVASAVCEPFHEGMSFFPIRELMRQLSTKHDLQAEIRAMYGDGSVQASMAAVAELSSVDPVARRDALLGTFANIVFGRAKSGAGTPLLLVIDDMERTDAGTTDSLLCLLARINDGPVAMLGTYRTDVVEANRAAHALTPLISAAARSGGRALDVHLRPIRESDLPDVVRAILGGDCDLPVQFRHQLWKQTEGNPLFLREVLRALQNDGSGPGPSLVLIDQRWMLQGNLTEWRTPETVEDAIRVRLDLMDAEVRGELERASVIGKRFAFEVMCRLSESDEGELLERLEECIHLSLIHESPDAPDSFEFTHGLIREVLYKSITRIRRKSLHSVVADSLQALRSIVSEDWEALIGEHLYQAGRYSEAAPVLFKAARQLLTVSAAAEASVLLEKSLDAAMRSKADAATISQIRITKVQALVAANEYSLARDLARQVCADLSTTAIVRAWALDYLGDIEWASGQMAAAFKAYLEAEVIAISETDTALELDVVADLAEAYDRAAEQIAGVDNERSSAYRKTADRYLTRQLALATMSADSAARSRALRNEAKRLRRAGDVAGAINKYEDSIALMDPRIASHSVLISYAKTLRFAGRYSEATTVVNRVLDWSMQSGARRSLGIAYYYRAVLNFDAHGAGDDVLEDLKCALSIHREIGYGRGLWEVQTLVGEWQLARGQRADAIDTFRSALDLQGEVDNSSVVTMVVDQLAAIDEHDRARSLRAAWETSSV
jgi:tetratricopeptide (TPR) repeat protein